MSKKVHQGGEGFKVAILKIDFGFLQSSSFALSQLSRRVCMLRTHHFFSNTLV